MMRTYLRLRQASAALQADAGAPDLFQARVFADLVVAAGKLWEREA